MEGERRREGKRDEKKSSEENLEIELLRMGRGTRVGGCRERWEGKETTKRIKMYYVCVQIPP